jgi:hypothetical protein
VTKVGQDKNGNQAKGKNKVRDGDEDRGKDIEVPNIYLSKVNK